MEMNTIKWHEKNIKNVDIYIEELEKELIDKEKQISRIKKDNQFYKMQVEMAKKQKNDYVIANFGASAFSYSVPSGFDSGLYEEVSSSSSSSSQRIF